MKLLSWMHRKQQKDIIGSFNGNSCLALKPSLNNQDDYARPGNNYKLKCQYYLEEFKVENTIYINNEESTEIFPGFLTIGTLSVEPVTEPPTPTFDLPQEKENGDGTSEMKYDLKIITEELEKFLRAEAENEGNNEPSGRNSQASDITLVDKEKEEVDDHSYIEMQAYPLKGYLLASSTELWEIKQQTKKERTSLQDLFQNPITADKSSFTEAEEPKKKVKKLDSSIRFMNKMLQSPKKRASLKNFNASESCAVESFPTTTKLSKIKKLFHKKIHPEISTTEKDPDKHGKNETGKSLNRPMHSDADAAHNCESTGMGCWSTLMKGGENHQLKAVMKLPRHARTKEKVKNSPNDDVGSACKEQWINTDADYLVLEL